MVALVNYMSQILVELIKLANLIILISKAMASMNRVDSVFAVQPGIQEGRSPEREDCRQGEKELLKAGGDIPKEAFVRPLE